MPYDLLTQYLKLPVFLMVVSRLAGLIMFQPLLGTLAIPRRVRILLVVGLAALVAPFVNTAVTLPATPGGIVLAMASEVLLGGLIGLMAAICFVGLQMGGTLIAQQAGLAFGQIADPSTGQQQSVLSSFYVQLACVIYLVAGGHRALLAACLDTFDSIPLLSETNRALVGAPLLLDALTVGGQVALRVAAPAVVTIFMATVALGFISRTVPQINIATVGFSLKSLIGFALMAISLPTAMTAFVDTLDCIVGWLSVLTGP